MGRRGRASSRGRGTLTSKLAQVVPAIPTFNVDDGFTYIVPDRLDVDVGRMVRVRLGGRRVRGFVVSTRRGSSEGLREIDAVSGDLPVFDRALLETLRWAAIHYVAPLSVLLAKAAPANLPRRPSKLDPVPTPPRAGRAAKAVIGGNPLEEAREVAAGGGALILAPTVAEARAVALHLAEEARDRVALVAAEIPGAETTRAWVRAVVDPDLVVVGTRETMWWPVPGGRALVLDEARAGMQDKQTPTVHAGEIMRRRSLVERVSVTFWSPVTSLSALANGIGTLSRGRAWPPVEVVDRRRDHGLLAQPTIAAVRAIVRRGGRVFCFARLRGFSAALRCVGCSELRLCPDCGAALPPSGSCPRCGSHTSACARCGGKRFQALGVGAGRLIEEMSRFVRPDSVGDAGAARPVVVGTERDLPRVGTFDLAIVPDLDDLLTAPHFRAEEHALHLTVRVARLVAGRQRRAIVQTYRPGHRVVTALRTGRTSSLATTWLEERARDALPPVGDLVILHVEEAPPDAAARISALVGDKAALHHHTDDDRTRFVIQGDDLRHIRLGLRGLVQAWRDAGSRVRIEVDPKRL